MQADRKTCRQNLEIAGRNRNKRNEDITFYNTRKKKIEIQLKFQRNYDFQMQFFIFILFWFLIFSRDEQ